MEQAPETSLDRFVRTRGAQMLGYSTSRIHSRIHIAIGAVLGAVAVGMVAAPSFGGDPGIVAGALGPMIAGAVNLFLGISMLRRFGNEPIQPVELSSDAKALLMALHRRSTGWLTPFGLGPASRRGLGVDVIWVGTPIHSLHERKRTRQMSMWQGVDADMIPQNLHDDELQYLERVAREYNRTVGALEAGKSSNSALAKLAPRILSAADEAMAEALHQAAMYVRYPEGGVAARSRLEAQERALGELAERVEQMTASQPGLGDAIVRRSGMDDVLDELRLEQLARSELRQGTQDENQEQRS